MKKPDIMNGTFLEAFLVANDLTNESFAEIIGVTHNCVDHWLHGRRKIPVTTVKLIKYFIDHPKAMQDF